MSKKTLDSDSDWYVSMWADNQRTIPMMMGVWLPSCQMLSVIQDHEDPHQFRAMFGRYDQVFDNLPDWHAAQQQAVAFACKCVESDIARLNGLLMALTNMSDA